MGQEKPLPTISLTRGMNHSMTMHPRAVKGYEALVTYETDVRCRPLSETLSMILPSSSAFS